MESRTVNATRNAIFGVIYKVITILFPFLIRTVMIYILGSEYVGLNSLFTSILSFLSLAELGIGQALVYSMYKPIAEKENDKICALLNLYRKLYRLIGLIVLAVGLLLMPFLKYIVKSGTPADVNLYVLYGIYLVNLVASYWVYGYKQSLLVANQRSDIVSKRSIVVQTLMYVMQVCVLLIFKDYFLYIILLPIFTIITNLANSVIVDRMYPEYKCYGKVEKDVENSIRKKVIALFGTKANSVIMHALDNIVISAFLGLVMVGDYGNYYYILNAIIGVMTIIYSSLTAGLGNSLVVDSKEKVYQDFNLLSFLNAWMVSWCSVCLLCLYQPFMKIWVGEKRMLDFTIVILLVIYFFVYQIRRIVLTYKDAGGIWWEDRFRPYVMMLTNVVGNLILVQIIGLYGVILSTIIAMFVSWPWEIHILFKHLLKRSTLEYYKSLGIYIICTALISIATYFVCQFLPNGFVGLILRVIVCAIVPNVLFVLFFFKKKEFSKFLRKICSFRK